ncbi:hypothetical protein NWF32_23335 [Pseudomonas qingdaonensis]|nr:hypothetical protein [Pseudomonas qingdaonensis]
MSERAMARPGASRSAPSSTRRSTCWSSTAMSWMPTARRWSTTWASSARACSNRSANWPCRRSVAC